MKRLLFAMATLGLVATPVCAQAPAITYTDTTTLDNGTTRQGPVLVTPAKPLPVTASFAGFTPTAGATANLSASTTSADVALPAGATIVVTNTGAVDAAFRIQAGAGTAVTTDQVIKAGAAVGLTVGSATHLSAITASGTTTLNIQGGSGAASGYGGGGASSNASVGTNGAAIPGSSTVIGSKDGSGNTQPASTTNPIPVSDAALLTAAAAATPAGTNIIGKVGIDQTTPGTTNGIAITNPAGGGPVQVSMFGDLAVLPSPTSVFADAFDGGSVDTTNNWTVQTGSGGTVTQASGSLSITAGTTASAYAAIFTKNTFLTPGKSFQEPAFRVAIENPVKANVKRFWGLATVPATPTVASPVTDGVGFELTETGVFRAVVYAGGSVSASTNLTAPADANTHTYWIRYVSGYYQFFSDAGANPAIPLALLTTDPPTNSLPMTMLAVDGATPPSSGQSMGVTATDMSDYAKNTSQLSDGVYAWRKATVKAASTAAASTDLPLVVGLHPSSPLPAGSNLVGKFGIDQTTNGTTNAINIPDGYDVTLGAKADAANCATGNTGIACLRQLHADATAAIPAGTNTIGNVGVAQGSTTSGQSGPLAQAAVSTANPAYTTAQTSPLSLNITGALRTKNGPGTMESCASGNVANATVACTLAASAGHLTYIDGFSMTASGATAGLAVTCTLTGTITGTKSYTFVYPAGVLVGATPLNVIFEPPLPASAVNTTIVASCPASGAGGTNATMTAEGFQE